jgi:metal-dependent amidase/aminoacylase/carboxypeptidase family protein
MHRMAAWLEGAVARRAERDGLHARIVSTDIFPATVNAPGAVEIVRKAAGDRLTPSVPPPARWSEDFGRLAAAARGGGALFGLGAGERCPALHDGTYDFPDELIPIGTAMDLEIVRSILN